MDSLVDLAKMAFSSEDAFDAISETGRFLYVYNSTTLIASVGGIVGLILLGSLLWIAISAALTDKHYGGSYGGSYGGGSYRKRRAADGDENEPTFMDLLAMLDESFRKMEINNFDCQKRAVCEAHLRHAESKLGSVARQIKYVFSKMDDSVLEVLEPESADFFEDYFEAAERGRRNDNCAQLYQSCSATLRKPSRKSSNSLH